MLQNGKMIMLFGVLLIFIGVMASYGRNVPVLNKLGHLPGDIVFKKGDFVLYIPWVTSLLISCVIWIFVNIFRR